MSDKQVVCEDYEGEFDYNESWFTRDPVPVEDQNSPTVKIRNLYLSLMPRLEALMSAVQCIHTFTKLLGTSQNVLEETERGAKTDDSDKPVNN